MKLKGFQNYLSFAIKFILILSIINSISNKLWFIVSTNTFLLVLMFVPQLIKKYKVKLPASFEWLLLVFVIFTLFLGKIGGIITPIFFGIAIAFIGFMILAILYSGGQIKKNYSLILLFSFSFTVAFGFLLELLKYYLKLFLGHELSPNIYRFSMQNMSFVIVGALIASIVGYIYMKSEKGIIRQVVGKITSKNKQIFASKIDFPEEVIELIKKGESENIEFKSTLRTNLYTKEIDKKMELVILKTLTAFLNSSGGTLLIGVNDKGEILGIEKDKFENIDKFNLHLTNLIKEKIGQKHLHLIEIQDILIEGKTIVKVHCEKSKVPVFLRLASNEEEFYIRSGPASIQNKGSDLVEYISRKFE